MNKVLPQSIDAEQAILGAIILYPNLGFRVMDLGIEAEEFYLVKHQELFKVIKELITDNIQIDAVVLMNRLTEQKKEDFIGGAAYLAELASTATTQVNIENYVNIVRNKYRVRRLIEIANTIAEAGYLNDGNYGELLEKAEKDILSVTQDRLVSDFKSSKDVSQAVYANIRDKSESEEGLTGAKTGYHDLDFMTKGFQKGDLIILAARPSVGKTAFSLNLGMKIAHHSKEPVAFFSLEMSAEQLMQRMLSSRSEIEGGKFLSGKLTKSEWEKLNAASMYMTQLPFYVDDSPLIKLSEMMAKCRKLQREVGLSAIIVDYIQLITTYSRGENRQQEVSEISRGLKALARELKVPVIALSQLSRSVEQRVNKRPMLSDLRESGAIEQDADIVMFLYRDLYNRQDDEEITYDNNQEQSIEIIVAKHRNGPIGTVELVYTPSINTFYNIDKKGGNI